MTYTSEEIKEKILDILKKAGVTHSALFGSTSQGKATEASDVDLLVEFEKGKSLLDLAQLKADLEEALQKKVDVVTYQSLSPLMREQILKEQVPIL